MAAKNDIDHVEQIEKTKGKRFCSAVGAVALVALDLMLDLAALRFGFVPVDGQAVSRLCVESDCIECDTMGNLWVYSQILEN